MAITCDIDFENNPNKIFYAGQLLRGTVRLRLNDRKNVRGVHIRIDGKAYCRWTRNGGRRHRVYIGNELYLNETKYLVGGDEGKMIGRMTVPKSFDYNNFECKNCLINR